MSSELESLIGEYFAACRGGVSLPTRVQKFMSSYALETLLVEGTEEVENMSSDVFVKAVSKCPDYGKAVPEEILRSAADWFASEVTEGKILKVATPASCKPARQAGRHAGGACDRGDQGG